MNTREVWYSQSMVLYEMVKCLNHRELSFLPLIRALNVYKVDELKKVFKLVNFFKKNPNMYRSVARLLSIPRFTYNPRERSKQTITWFQNHFCESVCSYDIFMDFDFDTPKDGKYKNKWDKILEEIKEFVSYLNEYKVPYYLIFSGSKGFHIIIEYKYLPRNLNFNLKNKNNIYDWTKRFIINARERFNLRFLDLRNIGVPSRLMKLPYSLSKENLVVLPLSQEQLENFKLEDMKAEKVLRNIKLFKRGLLEREGNIEEFINEFNLIK